MSLLDELSLAAGFRRYFRIQSANDRRAMEDVFRIRHEVYCEDLGFEELREDRLETDEHDRNSQHCLLHTEDETHEPVGCTRVVMTDPDDRSQPLPFEITCAATLDRSIIDPAAQPRERIGEVSRLAVRRHFRRRKGEENGSVSIQNDDFGKPGQTRFPYIPVSLYLGAIALAERNGLDTLFVLTEPRLATHFARLGVDIRQIGGPVSHRGVRIPSMLKVREVIDDMRPTLRPLWTVVRDEIAQSFVAGDPR